MSVDAHQGHIFINYTGWKLRNKFPTFIPRVKKALLPTSPKIPNQAINIIILIAQLILSCLINTRLIWKGGISSQGLSF